MTQLELTPQPQPNHGLSPFDEIRKVDADGEYWLARDLMGLMDYTRWEKFAIVVNKAKDSLALVEGQEQAEHHFTIRGSDGGRWGNAKVEDFRLTRFGAYLTAMAGDDTKRAVAEARIYFAVQTRRAEIQTGTPPQASELATLDINDPNTVIALAQAAQRAALQVIEERQLRQVAEQQLAVVVPKAESWDTLAAADGDFAVGDAAKILARDPSISLGQQRLFTVLRDLGWVYRGGDTRWRVKQAQIETGRLSEIPSSHYHPRTGELVLDPPQVRITAKGLHELHRRLGGSAPLVLPAP